ncbi:MAG: hypothetical protein U0350_41225 [Caldilineaceae bacterium]
MLAELDRRYRRFVQELPSPLQTLASDRSLITGEEPATSLQSVASLGFSVIFPCLFKAGFPGLSAQKQMHIGEAWFFLLLALLLRDHIADNQVPKSQDVLLLQQRFMMQARQVFYLCVGEATDFWTYFDNLNQQVIAALHQEAYHRRTPTAPYDQTNAWEIGVGKLALYKAVPWVMAANTGRWKDLTALETSLDALAAGRQLFDDVGDWQEDLLRGHYTYPLAQAMAHLSTAEAISSEMIAAVMLRSTIREDALRQATIWHKQALAAVENIPVQGWKELVNGSMNECIAYHRWLVLTRLGQQIKEKA